MVVNRISASLLRAIDEIEQGFCQRLQEHVGHAVVPAGNAQGHQSAWQ